MKSGNKVIWTYDKCNDVAKICSSRTDFSKKFNRAYNVSRQNNWLDDICQHMGEKLHKVNNYWNYETCKTAALECNNKTDFYKKYSQAGQHINKNKWFELFSHMKEKRKPNNYWSKEKCHEVALKYDNKKDFQQNEQSVYTISSNNNWIDEICSHMLILGSRYKRCIYAYEFEDNNVYIGLTYNVRKRNYNHLNNGKSSSVYKHITETNLTPIFNILTDYIDVEDAVIKEGEFVEKYKNDGWIILNKTKTGGVGGNVIKWDFYNCSEESKKYKSRKDFQINNVSAYHSSLKNGWLDDICSHMITRKMKQNKK